MTEHEIQRCTDAFGAYDMDPTDPVPPVHLLPYPGQEGWFIGIWDDGCNFIGVVSLSDHHHEVLLKPTDLDTMQSLANATPDLNVVGDDGRVVEPDYESRVAFYEQKGMTRSDAQGVVDAVTSTVDLLTLAREKDVPIIYTRVIYNQNGLDGGIFVQKVPILRTMVEGEPLADIVPELPPAGNDVIINKQYASAFFATPLAAMLTSMGVDTVILTGCSTSGCVRASAVDGMQHGFL